jgi:hypothetical protein
MIRHHAEEEEKELFPKVEKALGDQLEKLGTEMEAMFTEAIEAGYESTLSRTIPKTSVDETMVAQVNTGILGRPSSPSLA